MPTVHPAEIEAAERLIAAQTLACAAAEKLNMIVAETRLPQWIRDRALILWDQCRALAEEIEEVEL